MLLLSKFRREQSPKKTSHESPWITVVDKARLKELEEAAKRDGEAGIPGLKDEILSYYEQQIQQEARHWIHNTAQTMKLEDSKIYPRFIEARKDFCDTRDQYEKKMKELERLVQVLMMPTLYWAIVILLSACEVFVNFQAFETLFSAESSLTALLASVALAIMQLWAAHLMGGAVQQKKGRGWAILMVILLICTTAGLAYLRWQYIGNMEHQETVLMSRPRLNMDMVTGFFFAFNMLFLVLASWMAAKMHDPDESYEQIYKIYQKKREKLCRLKQLRDSNQEDYRRNAWDMIGMYRYLITKYRDLNIQHRETKATPNVWVSNPPEKVIEFDDKRFEIPDNESQLNDETCSKLAESMEGKER